MLSLCVLENKQLKNQGCFMFTYLVNYLLQNKLNKPSKLINRHCFEEVGWWRENIMRWYLGIVWNSSAYGLIRTTCELELTVRCVVSQKMKIMKVWLIAKCKSLIMFVWINCQVSKDKRERVCKREPMLIINWYICMHWSLGIDRVWLFF